MLEDADELQLPIDVLPVCARKDADHKAKTI
jgi:hypothetical protein